MYEPPPPDSDPLLEYYTRLTPEQRRTAFLYRTVGTAIGVVILVVILHFVL